MAEHDPITPPLPKHRLSHLSDEPQLIIPVDDDWASEEPANRIHNYETDPINNTHSLIENPFEFLGAGPLSVPSSTTMDPFRNHTPQIEGVYEWLKILICVPIAIVRLVLFGLSLLIGYVATKFALHGWKDKQNPMPKWRCRAMWVTRICARCVLFSFGYHWIKHRGRPAPRETAPIVVSNHVSYIDPIFFFYELFPTIVASESHDSIPFVGTIIRAMQVVYVNRSSPSSRKHAVNEIKTSHAIATALNVVQTSHSYGDIMLFAKASKSKQENPTLYTVEMARVESAFHLSSSEAVDFLDTFLSMNPDSSGEVKIHDFFRVLRLKACNLSEKVCYQIFRVLDVEQKGKITFKQFLYGSAHVLKQPLFRQACELAFVECYTGGNHYITEQELGDSIRQAIPNMDEFEINKDDFIACLRRNPLLVALFSPQLMHKNLSGVYDT
ncbi:lysophospholipid acyltransferase LPEAT2-like [Camellia sinensis]|uniref:lysophospholipid acyltransferase LPEAT2-like n=1 Tax=Camellia sinensis TaxID=4442 RepID=UPI0010365822|nr:lysophospholipid acyltransferase LPEAT2-like [Camellia sinensis]